MGKLSKNIRFEIHNRFDIEVVDKNTGVIKQKAKAFNVVTNTAFNILCSNPSGASDHCAPYIVVGSGTGTPAATDTSLFHYVGYASMQSDTIDTSRTAEGIFIRTAVGRINYDTYVNTDFTEVGLARATSGTPLFTHAVLQDMNGNPITIRHTDTDIINLYAHVYLHVDQDHDTHFYYRYGTSNTWGSVSLVGLALFFKPNISNPVVQYPYALGSAYFFNGGPHVYASSYDAVVNYKTITPDPTNRRVIIAFNRLSTDHGNIKGISSIGFDAGYGKAWPSTIVDCGGSNIAPSSIQGESVGVGDGNTLKFKTKFDMPYNAKVYVNGIEQQSGVIVKKWICSALTPRDSQGSNGYPYCTWYKRLYANNLNLPVPYRDRLSQMFVGEVLESLMPEVGIYGFYNANTGTYQASNDGITWVNVATPSSEQIADADAHYKYYKLVTKGNYDIFLESNTYDGYNIIFDTPPAQGDVITIDYTTDYIPKDSDHVLDVELTVSFGEWQGN